ncbi:GNAT family N-acetyltransferase [Actinomadura kijaniata]|uniref:GNAT family N-acetyltransferase n=1 Tax=Actinomadura kijaniata TaxID=46161 RepID=UPI003F19E8F2
MLSLALADDAELRPLEPWRTAEFAAHVAKIREELKPWIPWAYTVEDEESARALLQDYADRQAADTGRLYGIWVDGELAGGTLFRTFDAAQGVCEVGVWLAAAHRGRGLITTAVRHMIDWAFDVRGMSRVEWHCAPGNAPSIATAERLGFTYEGTLRSAAEVGGSRRDYQIWAMLADERP